MCVSKVVETVVTSSATSHFSCVLPVSSPWAGVGGKHLGVKCQFSTPGCLFFPWLKALILLLQLITLIFGLWPSNPSSFSFCPSSSSSSSSFSSSPSSSFCSSTTLHFEPLGSLAHGFPGRWWWSGSLFHSLPILMQLRTPVFVGRLDQTHLSPMASECLPRFTSYIHIPLFYTVALMNHYRQIS